MEKREPSYTVGGNVNWCRHYGEHGMEVPLKTKYRATIRSRDPKPGDISRGNHNAESAPRCSLQHCSQRPRHGDDLNTHEQVDG